MRGADPVGRRGAHGQGSGEEATKHAFMIFKPDFCVTERTECVRVCSFTNTRSLVSRN